MFSYSVNINILPNYIKLLYFLFYYNYLVCLFYILLTTSFGHSIYIYIYVKTSILILQIRQYIPTSKNPNILQIKITNHIYEVEKCMKGVLIKSAASYVSHAQSKESEAADVIRSLYKRDFRIRTVNSLCQSSLCS